MVITNDKYWNQRYEAGIGSGVGSRGQFAKQKEHLVREIIKEYAVKNILDIGCGDLYWMKNIHVKDYVGVDFSDEALKECRELKPEWIFKNIDYTKEMKRDHADLVICFDVLIHQTTREKYDLLIDNLLESTNKVALISGWREPPMKHGPSMYFYETIYETMTQRCVLFNPRLSYRESVILECMI